MGLSNYDPNARYKNRASQRMASLASMLGVIFVSAVIGFWIGRQSGAESVIKLKEENKNYVKELEELQQNVTDLRAEAQTANTRYEQIKKEYAELIPEGPMQDLVALVRKQLDGGMDPQRLSFFVRSARPPTDCSDPEVKRFVVSTPAYRGPASLVSVADSQVVISGKGTSARNSKGQPEAWFDPAQSVTVTFQSPSGKETKRGTLPIQHSVVAGNREYRFTIEEGARSFVKVIFDSCAYP